jgi:signal transduction histidine kinase
LAWLRAEGFGHVGSTEGFESDNVGQLIDDGTGHLWVGTAVGLARLEKGQLLGKTYGGSPSREFIEFGGLRSSHAASTFPVAAGGVRANDGRLWFTTANGVAVLDTSSPPDTPSVRPAAIIGVRADGRAVDTREAVRLTSDSRQLEIRYAAVSLSGAHLVRYRYRLLGVDADWIDAGPSRSAVYGQLPPGHYRFEVIASAGNAVAGPAATIEVTRVAAWHEAAWFPFAIALAVLVGASAVHRARARRAQAQFSLVLAERNRISRDLHDTLSQHVVGIASQLGAVANTLRVAPDEAERHLGVARKMAQHSLTEARRTIMDLRSAPDSRDLRDVIDDAVQPMAAGSPSTVVVRGQAADGLSAFTRQHLLRIAQEATANALAHARPRLVTIDLTDDHTTVSLVIHDDGLGFDPSTAATAEDGHFGLVGLRERAAQLGGTCTVDSRPGNGTTVSVRVPIS